MEHKEKSTGLTPKEAAEFIGCSEYTIKQLAREKRIPHYRIGVRIMFTRPALVKWIANQEKRNYIFE
jgi:excisionase family DNA binding protein